MSISCGLALTLALKLVKPAALSWTRCRELRVIRCVGVPGVETGVAVRITGQGTATQELRRGQVCRDQADALSHTGSFGTGSYPAENWFARTRLFDSLSTNRSVTPTLDLFRAHTPRRFEFGPAEVSETIGSELPISYAPHVLRK